MQTFLDETVFEDTNAGPSIGHLIEAARAKCSAGGRVLVEIMLNDEPISEEAMSLPIDATGSSVNEDCLSMTSADPYDLVIETAEQAGGAITEVIRLQFETAELIQAGQLAEALPKLMEVINTWQQIQRCVEDGAQLVQMPLDDLESGIGEGEEGNAIVTLRNQLTEIRDSIVNQDLVTLSDCLAYEMEPVADQWRGLLDRFVEALESRRSGGE